MRPRVAELRQQIALNAVTSSSGRACSSKSVRTLASAAQATHASEMPACTVHREDAAASRSNDAVDGASDARVGCAAVYRPSAHANKARERRQKPFSLKAYSQGLT